MIKAQIDPGKVRGEGKKIYIVVTVDQEDPEDTSTEIWRANDEDHLYEQVKEDFIGHNENIEPGSLSERISDDFEADWCYSILYTEIGKTV